MTAVTQGTPSNWKRKKEGRGEKTLENESEEKLHVNHLQWRGN